MRRALLAFGIVVVALLSNVVEADLPVHCLHVQITGTWVFEMSRNDGDRSTHCGHNVPDKNADHFTKDGYPLEVVRRYTVNLSEPNMVVDDQGRRGTWTMVYDEGFEVTIDGKKFFAFNKYVPKTPESLEKDDVEDYNSICWETLVGWFHDFDGTHWGCYHGTKIAGSGVNGQGGYLNQQQRRPQRRSNQQPILSPFAISPRDNRDDFAGLEVAATATAAQAKPLVARHLPVHEVEPFEDDDMFVHDTAFIELVNTDNSRTWRAGVHEEFKGKRMGEMMRLLGRQKHKRAVHERVRAKVDNRPDDQKYAGLPRFFDWRNHNGKNFDSGIKNQGNCGSCYAMAAISVAEARVRILSDMKDKTLLSSQAVVSCSIYNQGCDGGYPYLVAKHAQDFGLVPNGCMKYAGEDGTCVFTRSPDCPDPSNPPTYKAFNYTYVGGYYGACTEAAMMREIYDHGPIMVAFEAPSSLFYYQGGVYTGEAPPHEGPLLPNVRMWEKTNHAVVAVGWGEENGVKYWIVKNTWGPTWGEAGYFRIRRGTDECGIESMASTMYLELPRY